MKKILSLTVAFAFAFGLVALAPSASNAAGNTFNDGVCNGVNVVLQGQSAKDGSGVAGCDNGDADGSLAALVNKVIDLFSIVVGAVSVLMIIYGGFKYITSGGSDDGTKAAKNTILYALVGLVIVLISQTIVKFVFTKALQLNGDSSQ